MNMIQPLTKCHRTELYSCSHICLYGKALAWAIDVPSMGITKEGRLCTHATLAR